MIRRLMITVLFSFSIMASAQAFSLDSVCLNDSAVMPYYSTALDSFKQLDTTGLLDSAQVRSTCDSVIISIKFGFLTLPLYVVSKMNACSLHVVMFAPGSATGVQDSVINACQFLPVRYSLPGIRIPAQNGITISKLVQNSGKMLIRYSAGPARITITSAAGRIVRTFTSTTSWAVWDGRDNANKPVKNGLYLCSVRLNDGKIVAATFVK
jgi:hypothetical protein